MVNDSKEMLKKVGSFDLVILLLAFVSSMFLFPDEKLALIAGLAAALVNFILNALITNYSIMVAGNRIILMLGTVVRIIVTAALAVMLCRNNMNHLIAFLVGYSLHYISVIIYGATRGTKKR